jgi:hypothetical protein
MSTVANIPVDSGSIPRWQVVVGEFTGDFAAFKNRSWRDGRFPGLICGAPAVEASYRAPSASRRAEREYSVGAVGRSIEKKMPPGRW